MTPGRVPLADALATPESKRTYVRRLFTTIADRYDLITVLLSFGLDARWKRRAVHLAAPAAGQDALDLACGTGDLTFAVASRGARVTGLDITHRMLQLARLRGANTIASARQAWVTPHPAPPTPHPAPRTRHPAPPTPHPVFVQADMTALPFENATFELVTTGYGLRNVPDLEKALDEIHRVLRPGGTLVSLDFNRPANAAVRAVYLAYLSAVGGALGWVLHRDPDTYRYIPASIRRYPGAPAVAALMKRRGFARAEWLPVLGGLMAIHVARR